MGQKCTKPTYSEEDDRNLFNENYQSVVEKIERDRERDFKELFAPITLSREQCNSVARRWIERSVPFRVPTDVIAIIQVFYYDVSNNWIWPKSCLVLFVGSCTGGKSTILNRLRKQKQGKFKIGGTDLTRDYQSQAIPSMQNLVRKAFRHTATDPLAKIGVSVRGIANFVQENQRQTIATQLSASNCPFTWHDLKNLWLDRGIQHVHYKYPDPDASRELLAWFFSRIDEICSPSFKPTLEDYLYNYKRTSGVSKPQYISKSRKRFWICDAGGARSERKKWPSVFQMTGICVIVVPLTCYNEFLFTDERRNGLQDALEMFERLINEKRLTQSKIVLVLNKWDIFQEHVQRVPLSARLDDFPQDKDFDLMFARDFILNKFLQIVQKSSSFDRVLYYTTTSAVDLESVKTFWQGVELLPSNNNSRKHSLQEYDRRRFANKF